MKNIIIIHTDQQRYDSLSCNGNPHTQTKNIDALAKDGCNFSRHIVCNPVCSPSRASLLTGLTVPGHGVSSNGIPLWRRDNGCEDKNRDIGRKLFGVEVVDKVPTLADILGEQGYETSLFGKLHLGPSLADESYGFYESYALWEKEETENESRPYYGFQNHKLILGHGEAPSQFNRGHYGRWLHKKHPELVKELDENIELKSKEDVVRKDIYQSVIHSDLHHSNWLAEEVCDYLERSDKNGSPKFMFIGFPDPHVPFTPPYDIAENFVDIDIPSMADVAEIDKEKPVYINELIERFRSDKRDIAQAYRYTSAAVNLIDKSVGKIINKLKQKGLYEDSIIVFTSDHGDFLGDLDMLTKYDAPFHNLLHVPFILKGAKDQFLPQSVSRAMSNADVAPTLLSLAGISIPDTMQGVNIFDESLTDHKPFVTCFSASGRNRSLTLYDKNFRYSYYIDTGEQELYDHDHDYQELSNLANDQEYIEQCCQYKHEVFRQYVEHDIGIYNHYGLW